MKEAKSESSFPSAPFALGVATAFAIGGLSFIIGRYSSSSRQKTKQIYKTWTSVGKENQSNSGKIQRWYDSPRSSGVVRHNGVVYLSGQVGEIELLEKSDCAVQTQQTLAKIDSLLEVAGTSKHNLLSAQIWVKDITKHFEPMNQVWNEYVAECGPNKPVRACVESKMARPSILVEIQVIAAMPPPCEQ